MLDVRHQGTNRTQIRGKGVTMKGKVPSIEQRKTTSKSRVLYHHEMSFENSDETLLTILCEARVI